MGVERKLSKKKEPLKNKNRRTAITMSFNQIIPFALILAVNPQSSLGSVAVGVGTRNPADATECLDPDTGLNHTIGTAWRLPGICGEAHCETRGENIYISYAFCGSAYAEYPCFLTAEAELPYPYCCPRSFCPTDLDISTNEINTDNCDDELQMAANDINDVVIVRAPESFNNFDSNTKSLSSSQENAVNYDVDMNDADDAEESS